MRDKRTHTSSMAWNVAHGIVAGWAAAIYPFMRVRMGKRHPGLLGLVAIAWIVIWSLHMRTDRLLILAPVYVACMVWGYVCHSVKPVDVHTHYGGEPVLAMKLFGMTEATAKRFGEPLISVVIGLGLIACGFVEGKFFAWGACTLIMNQRLIEWGEGRLVDDMRDGMIEGHYIMEKAKEKVDGAGKIERRAEGAGAAGSEGFAQRNNPGIPAKRA